MVFIRMTYAPFFIASPPAGDGLIISFPLLPSSSSPVSFSLSFPPSSPQGFDEYMNLVLDDAKEVPTALI
jgi:hypothetical protein